MAQLEFLFIDALDDSKHGIQNLESQIAQSPAVFVKAVALAYKQSDEGEDPPEWRVENPEQRAAVALTVHRLLDQIKMILGTDENGRIHAEALVAWVTEVWRLCREYARNDIGDHCLGQLFARTPEGENGIWPCEAICSVHLFTRFKNFSRKDGNYFKKFDIKSFKRISKVSDPNPGFPIQRLVAMQFLMHFQASAFFRANWTINFRAAISKNSERLLYSPIYRSIALSTSSDSVIDVLVFIPLRYYFNGLCQYFSLESGRNTARTTFFCFPVRSRRTLVKQGISLPPSKMYDAGRAIRFALDI